MKKVGVVYLITESPEAKGVLETPEETRRKTFCEERSISQTEVYQAKASGHSPSIRLKLPLDFEYKGETICEYKGVRYNILRDYGDEKTVSTELTLERVRGNAASTEPAEPEPEEPGTGTTEPEPAEEPEGTEDEET